MAAILGLLALALVLGVLAGVAYLCFVTFGGLARLVRAIRGNAAWVTPSAVVYVAVGYFNSDYTLAARPADPFRAPEVWGPLLDRVTATAFWPYFYLAKQPVNAALLLLAFGAVAVFFLAMSRAIPEQNREHAKALSDLATARRQLARQEEEAKAEASRERRRLHGIIATRDAELAQVREREQLLMFERGAASPSAAPHRQLAHDLEILPPGSVADDDLGDLYGE